MTEQLHFVLGSNYDILSFILVDDTYNKRELVYSQPCTILASNDITYCYIVIIMRLRMYKFENCYGDETSGDILKIIYNESSIIETHRIHCS